MSRMIAIDELQGNGIRHAFFGRRGGVSGGIYNSLNCGLGSRDDPAAVAENRTRVSAALDADALVTCYQVHGRDVAEVTRPWTPDRAPRVDGLVTRTPGIALGILTADCAPVLLFDAADRVVGAAHAGWTGAKAGILEATVEAMTKLGAAPANISAVIGPCIAQASYEVGPEFPAPFLAEDDANRRFFAPSRREGRFMFDLGGYAENRLRRLGLARVMRLARDTCREETDFFSYRRATLRGEPDYGREISLVALEA
jgi:YfiH family protein